MKKRIYDNNWNVDLLEDVMLSKKKPQFGKTIFFHETSCGNGVVQLNARYLFFY